MKYTIPGWVHNPGLHCASTAISDAMTFQGHDLAEPACFGLGCGLGFAYFASDLVSPTRMTAVRSRILEPRFFENLEMPFQWHTHPGPEEALASAREHVRAHRPLILRADIAFLPYYNTNTRFSGHIVGLWGIDDEEGIALIADTGWEGLQKVPYPEFGKARFSSMGYISNSGENFPIQPPDSIGDLGKAAKKALRQQAQDLFGLKIDVPAVFGFEGMKSAARAMPDWGKADDWNWCARWFYQVIEKRGTGGGAFRLLYARFLEWAAGLDPAIRDIAPAEEMHDIAREWTELSLFLKQISEGEDPGPLNDAAASLDRIRRREEDFFKRAQDRL